MKIVLLGMPTAGKDTQADVLCKRFNLKHISTGEMFRNEMVNETKLGKKIDTIMKAGKFVDDDTTIKVVEKTLKDKDKFILNGFPRNLKQSKWFDSWCTDNDIKIDHYIYLDLEEKSARKRIKKRSQEINRPEDATKESVDNRFKIFKKDTLPGINYYKDRESFITIQAQLPIPIVTMMICTMIKGPNGRYF